MQREKNNLKNKEIRTCMTIDLKGKTLATYMRLRTHSSGEGEGGDYFVRTNYRFSNPSDEA